MASGPCTFTTSSWPVWMSGTSASGAELSVTDPAGLFCYPSSRLLHSRANLSQVQAVHLSVEQALVGGQLGFGHHGQADPQNFAPN